MRLESINISCSDASLRIKYAMSPLVSLSKKASYKEVAIIHNFVAFVVVLVNVRQNLIFLFVQCLWSDRDSDHRWTDHRDRQIPGQPAEDFNLARGYQLPSTGTRRANLPLSGF